jgi:hypothetical protein
VPLKRQKRTSRLIQKCRFIEKASINISFIEYKESYILKTYQQRALNPGAVELIPEHATDSTHLEGHFNIRRLPNFWRASSLTWKYQEELDGSAVTALRRTIAEVKQRWSLDGWPKIYYLELLRASEGTFAAFAVVSTHQSELSPRGGFSLCVIHKEGLCFSSINRLMMIINCTVKRIIARKSSSKIYIQLPVPYLRNSV